MKTQATFTLLFDGKTLSFMKVIDIEKALSHEIIKYNNMKYTIKDVFTTINHKTGAQTQTIQTYPLSANSAEEMDELTAEFLLADWSIVK